MILPAILIGLSLTDVEPPATAQIICAKVEGAEGPTENGWQRTDAQCEQPIEYEDEWRASRDELLDFYGEPNLSSANALEEHALRVRLQVSQVFGDDVIIRYDFRSPEDLRTTIKFITRKPLTNEQIEDEDLQLAEVFDIIELRSRQANSGFAKVAFERLRDQSIYAMPTLTDLAYSNGELMVHNFEGTTYTLEIADAEWGYKLVERGITFDIQPPHYLKLIEDLVLYSGLPMFSEIYHARYR